MNGRLQLIEEKLKSISGATFQNLCDIYLSLREQELSSLNRTGSQLGKQKTVKGTPDTFYRLKDGSLRYVEYTTQADRFVEKIIGDIDKCLDVSKTGIPANEVHEIIICFNSRLEVAEETEITKYADSKSVRIKLIGLDWLALEIYSKYLILARDILGIPLDTGQLLPFTNFIGEYNNKAGKLSTPLDNIFLHRENELAEIKNILESKDLIILSGFPGVGKTKLGIEVIKQFLKLHDDYSTFVVLKKDQDIAEDLKIHLQQDKNYILLVDDANRQLLNLKQILGVFKEVRKGNIKLLITVRDYALNDVMIECTDFAPATMVLEKFTDKEITALISSDSFGIKNSKYQKIIIELSDGNARLAVMAAKLAMQKQQLFLHDDASDLYDSYFQTFIKDFDIFGNKTLLKTLGLISFFFTIDRSNKEFIEGLLKNFELEYHDFNEAINELEKRELVEVQYNHARVSEQVMATYFFYKVFIKDELLSFKTLLFNYFPNWKKRFHEAIIPANNSFGYENVLDKINDILNQYLEAIYADEEKALEFFELFWFYKHEEILNYFHQKIQRLPEPENPVYICDYQHNDFVWDRDKTLDFLSNFFNYYTVSLLPALELAFEYCRKKPESLPELVKRIREKMLFDDDDSGTDFLRQSTLFELLMKRFKRKEPHYIETFFALSRTFLSHYYRITKGGRNHSIISYPYPLPFYEVTQNFRTTIWNTLFENFDVNPEKVFSVIKSYNVGVTDTIVKMLEFDLSLLIPFIETKLSRDQFSHIHFIWDFVDWLDRQKLVDRSYHQLKEMFNSREYQLFLKLDWNSLRGKPYFNFENHDDFRKLKERDIKQSFIFNNKGDFEILHRAITAYFSIEGTRTWGIDESLDIIAENNFLLNAELGYQLLTSIFNNYPLGIYTLSRTIKAIVSKSEDWAVKLWSLLKSWRHEYKLYWQLSFFDYLPLAFINGFYRDELLDTINSIEQACNLRFESFEKFTSLDKGIILKILKKAVEKIENQKLKILLPFQFFEKYSRVFPCDFDLVAKAYIQQEKINQHIDLERKGLEALVEINQKFLRTYLSQLYNDNNRLRNTHNNLSFVWNFENYETVIEEAVNLLIDHTTYYGIGNNPLDIFFQTLDLEKKNKAKKFILMYISKYHTNSKRMNAIFDILLKSLSEFFEEAFNSYLELNKDIEQFKKISWSGNGGIYSGDVIIGELHASNWLKILAIVERSSNQLDLIPIRNHIKKQIGYELRSGEEERKRKFIEPDW